jgi:hypothetical protein
MSNQFEIVTDLVTKAWQLPSRPDLLEDCIEFVWEHWEEGGDSSALIIKFLSTHCGQAVSSADLDFMANEEKKRNEQSV